MRFSLLRGRGEMADALVLGTSVARHVGSTPTVRTHIKSNASDIV